MNKKNRIRVALVISASAIYHTFGYVRHIQTGCMQLNGHQICSFENPDNFAGLLNLDLLFSCGWLAGALICWIGLIRSSKTTQ
jgi:hypothetical protein